MASKDALSMASAHNTILTNKLSGYASWKDGRKNGKFMTRRSHRRCSVKKGILRNFAKFTGNTCARVSFFNKVAGLGPATLLKKRSWHRCFPVNFAKLLRTPFLQNTSGLLLLHSMLSHKSGWKYVRQNRSHVLSFGKQINSDGHFYHICDL